MRLWNLPTEMIWKPDHLDSQSSAHKTSLNIVTPHILSGMVSCWEWYHGFTCINEIRKLSIFLDVFHCYLVIWSEQSFV
jgi:hypothetical protein